MKINFKPYPSKQKTTTTLIRTLLKNATNKKYIKQPINFFKGDKK